MSRVIKKHEERRMEILIAAQELFYEQGYEETTVNDILAKVGIAKGTFYHYFESKEAVLEAMVGRMADLIVPAIKASIEDPGLNAIEKMNKLLLVSGAIKAANKRFLTSMGKALWSDSNLLARRKMVGRNMALLAPIMSDIIRQGVEEGYFDTEYPEEAAEQIIHMARDITEGIASILFDSPEDPESRKLIERKYYFWGDAIERLLGAPIGSIEKAVRKTVDDYMDSEE